ncbi:MAG: hypothetical protein WBW33_02685 [Bryobacteraceae bacterium]
MAKIAVPELIGDGDHRCAHGPVFVSTLRPGSSAVLINPDSEAHGYQFSTADFGFGPNTEMNPG